MTMDPLFAWTDALALAALLGAAAAHQLAAWSEWPGIVRNYRLLPERLAAPAAAAIALAEAGAALALLWPPVRAAGAVLAAVLLAGFAGALAVNIARGRTHIDCGCFGARLGDSLSYGMVGRNLALAALALLLLLPTGARPLATWEAALVPGWVATLAVLYLAAEALRRVAAPAAPHGGRA